MTQDTQTPSRHRHKGHSGSCTICGDSHRGKLKWDADPNTVVTAGQALQQPQWWEEQGWFCNYCADINDRASTQCINCRRQRHTNPRWLVHQDKLNAQQQRIQSAEDMLVVERAFTNDAHRQWMKAKEEITHIEGALREAGELAAHWANMAADYSAAMGSATAKLREAEAKAALLDAWIAAERDHNYAPLKALLDAAGRPDMGVHFLYDALQQPKAGAYEYPQTATDAVEFAKSALTPKAMTPDQPEEIR